MINLGDQLASELAGLINGEPVGLADRHSARDVVGPVLDAIRLPPLLADREREVSKARVPVKRRVVLDFWIGLGTGHPRRCELLLHGHLW